ncbi:MAG: PepSY1/2 domain-containing protein [Candidatus Coproplasma sp.]
MAEKKNISSGAEKSEKLAKTNSVKHREEIEKENLADNSEGVTKESTVSKPKKAAAKKQRTTTGSGAKSGAKSQSSRSSSKRADKGEKRKAAQKRRQERLKARQEKKLERAKIKAEKKQKRLERKLAHKEKVQAHKAEIIKNREKIKAERQKRRELIKSESKEKRAKRIAEEKKAKRLAAAKRREQRIEEKRLKREQRLKAKQQKRTQRNNNRSEKRRQRTPGFGGWLAAVISLGVSTLALATIVTFGWISMDEMQSSMAGGYTQSLYELNAIVDDLDTNLARAKASSSATDRVRVFTDIAAQSQNAELILERFPLEMQTTERLTAFINGMSRDTKGMLYTIVSGNELSAEQIESLEYLYNTNAKVKTQLNKLIETTCEKDMLMAMRGGDCELSKVFATIQNNVFEEMPAKHGKHHTPAYLEGEEEITASQAESVAKRLFADYSVSGARCVGEAMGIIPMYNVNLTTPDGEMLVQLSKAGGKVVGFDSFKDCKDTNFSVDRCVAIAEDFIEKMGYSGLKPVWASVNGTTCNLHFATEQNGVIIYSDLVKIKVCEQRGIVTGMDASGYILRHRDRQIEEASISEEQAKSSINGNIEVSSTRLALIPVNGKDRLCYEFFGEMGGVEYYVYVDAQTGEELEVRTVINTKQGKVIK